MQTYRLLSGISSNEESGYFALLEKNERELPTEKQLGDSFRLSCAFEEEGGLGIITSGISPSTPIPTVCSIGSLRKPRQQRQRERR